LVSQLKGLVKQKTSIKKSAVGGSLEFSFDKINQMANEKNSNPNIPTIWPPNKQKFEPFMSPEDPSRHSGMKSSFATRQFPNST
jgi:hypothetical protein